MSISRRNLIKTIGALSLVPVGPLGCGSKDKTDETDDKTDDETGTVSGDTDDLIDTSTPDNSDTLTEDGWLIGGTALITASYPDDSIFDGTGDCSVSLTESTTAGPCYFQDSTGEDISEGLAGLPMLLCLKLIDSSCRPLNNHIVEIWHSDVNGVYSGDTSQSGDANDFSLDFCTGGDEPATQSSWYRGQLETDAEGRVNFKSCFPGWYPSRTIHIHFAVSDANGSSRVISQLCFTDELAKQICTTHPLYTHRGEQDTPIPIDGVFPSNSDSFLLKTQQNSDGTLLAYHTIQVT